LHRRRSSMKSRPQRTPDPVRRLTEDRASGWKGRRHRER
jgi:hypothetical protein